jgi:hypothetical protein
MSRRLLIGHAGAFIARKGGQGVNSGKARWRTKKKNPKTDDITLSAHEAVSPLRKQAAEPM